MLDINEIMKILPHRYPFLLVDKILEISEKSVVGIKNVTINEPYFTGHYPDQPIMPGVLIIETVAQVGALMIMYPKRESHLVPYLASIAGFKFRKPVNPGDQLKISAELISMKANMGKMKAKVFVDNGLVAEGEMMYALITRKEK